jgi:hypothetical protein
MKIVYRALPVLLVCGVLLFASCAGAPPEQYVPYEPPPPTLLHRISWWLTPFLVIDIVGGGLAMLLWHRTPDSFWGHVFFICIGMGAVAGVVELVLWLCGV